MEVVDAVVIERSKYPGDDRPVFVGQAPSRNGDPFKPLTGGPGRRLAEIAGMTPMEFYLSVVRTNLIPNYPGASSSGDAFPMYQARTNAVKLATVLGGRTVVFLGRGVAGAFDHDKRWFEWDEGKFKVGNLVIEARRVAVPHPSARSRFWNDPQNVQEARRFMTKLMKKKSSIPRLQMLRKRARAIDERQLDVRVS